MGKLSNSVRTLGNPLRKFPHKLRELGTPSGALGKAVAKFLNGRCYYRYAAARSQDPRHRLKPALTAADNEMRMLRPPAPKSTNERQRCFQAAHAGYDRARKARQRAATKHDAKAVAA